ncbi:MAG: sigma 54-interacting transcriptional regulator [Holophaga sp.]|nr:sigma 54-interacting transcriptional regulator [Holophaga sp.]
MKRLAVVTDNSRSHLAEALRSNLEEVLGGHVAVRHYTFNAMGPSDPVEADLVLVMVSDKIPLLTDHVADPRHILVVRRTLRERDVYRIFAIPSGARVLVVNDHPVTTLETVALLQQLKINHLRFIPYQEGMDCAELRIAITPGEKDRVPVGIPTVIDVGHRCIDISTFIEIINRLDIADPVVDRRLLRYSESIVTLDTGVNHQYKELYLKNTQLDTVINLSHDGILLVDPEGRITLHNRALAGMLDLQGDLAGAPLKALGPEIQEVLTRKSGQEWIVEHKGRSLVITRQAIQHLGEPAGSFFNFQEVTYIRQLEQNLSRKLREKGQTARYRFSDVLTRAPRMIQCVDLARRMAASDFTVLITGASGTGKELLAQSIHQASARSRQAFVAVNCAAVPENLLESELFGYEGGAFTGALKEGKTGLFEQANHGTVFLDEIADMPMVLQAKLLRVLQERQVVRVGSQKVVNVNIRVIAATNQDLREWIRRGRFREDLYYRLNTLPLVVPPLHQRPEDIFLLLEHFMAGQKRMGLSFTPEAREALMRYPWPGNIRELNNVASYLSFMTEQVVTLESLPHYLLDEHPSFEREEALLARCGLDRARTMLAALAAQEHGAGRKHLLDALARQGQALTEGQVRGCLRLLTQAGLVRATVGRRGSELTPRGASFLNGSSNRQA